MTDTRSAAQIFADIFGPAPTERERSLIVRVALPCERSIIALRSANLAERTGQKIVLQRQLSDLGMEHRQVRRRSGTLATRLGAEYPSRPVEKLRLPLGDLVGMNVELLC
jgi:hypothetical protein